MAKILEDCVRVEQDEHGQISIVNQDGEWILVSMDQKAHKSNERPLWYLKLFIFGWDCTMCTFSYWGDDEMTLLPPKGEGKLVMTCDFVTIFGLLKYDLKWYICGVT